MPHDKIRSFLHARDPSVDRRYRPRPERRVVLEDLIGEESSESGSYESLNEIASSTCSSSNGNLTQMDGAQVYLRLRPAKISVAYEPSGNVLIMKNGAQSGKTVTEKHFSFTDIMDGAMSQSEVYNKCIRRSIEAGENLTVLAYGTSGSGKTHTQIGTTEMPGIIPRALEHIFTMYGSTVHELPAINVVNAAINFLSDDDMLKHDKMRRKMLVENSSDRFIHNRLKNFILNEQKFETNETANQSVFVWISIAEIYNEIVYDLLNSSYEQDLTKKEGLTIFSNKGQVFVKNLTSICVRNSFEAHLLLELASQRVTYGSTAVNNHSSRSHCVFIIDIITYSYPDSVSHYSYKFCDLAGSERQDKTKNVGNRLKEAQRINTSLLVLGRCLDAVYHNQQKKSADVVPFRDSKLTTLLQAPLLGREKMTMIVNINPVDEYIEENLHVLGFASIAKNIVYKQKPKVQAKKSRYSWLATLPTINSSQLNNSHDYEMLQDENEQLRAEIQILSNEVTRLERNLTIQEMDLKKTLVKEYEAMMKKQDENWQKRLEQQKKYQQEYYEAKIQVMQAEYKLSEMRANDSTDTDSDDQ